MHFFKIIEILKPLKILNPPENDFKINALFKDSREVTKGALFLAQSDDIIDGHKFIEHAIKNGASTIIAEHETQISKKIPFIIVKHAAKAFAFLSQEFFNHPDSKLNITGITGTNGKTTITYILEEIFTMNKNSTGVIGTINYRYNKKIFLADNTTPHACHYYKLIDEMQKEKISYLFSEISSHGLKLNRTHALNINSAIFTNLTIDHLDFHKDMNDYYDSKRLLFTNLLTNSSKENKFAVINIDCPYGKRLFQELKENNFHKNFILKSFSLNKENFNSADYKIDNIKINTNGSSATFIYNNTSFDINSKLTGLHNLQNIALAISVAIHNDVPIQTIIDAIKNIKNIPGRLEKIKSSKYNIYVDYAHTPDAIKNVLLSLRKVSSSKIITVLGCGGDRDKTKRPLMGEIAAKNSDLVLITSDNPRTEDPMKIIEDILPGVKKVTSSYEVEVDRKKAIQKSIDIAQNDDIILIAGKGHEDYQIIGTKKHVFSDAQIVRDYLNDIK